MGELEGKYNDEHLTTKAVYDYKLVQAALEGDQKAYAELMQRYKEGVYFTMHKMVNNKDDAEDLTIEAFGRAFKRLEQYSPAYAFSTWLFRIATNNAIDFIRKRKQMQSVSLDTKQDSGGGDQMDGAQMIKSAGPDPEEHLLKKQKIETLREVVNTLKPKYKELVELFYYQEMSYEEIAQQLNLPIGTIKAQLFRAREVLYQIMKTKHI
ncbi:MAG: sigma-70 family RNA polymerase sigma factor [Sediminibacterium sp.]|nr:sigma-70 family RNA polymerase sigma factor [Sediminibacterium sp.]